MTDDRDNIRVLPTLNNTQVSADDILENSKDKYESVVVFGYSKGEEGEIICSSNVGSLAFVNLMVDQFKQELIIYEHEELDE